MARATKQPSKSASRSKSSSRPKFTPGGDDDQHPRPMLRRPGWRSLDGEWDFVLDREGRHVRPEAVAWKRARTIRVPFAPETPASGIEETGYFRACWYRRSFEAPKLKAGQRLILHLGAVDYRARVWVDGRLVVEHEGGYSPFSADITDVLGEGKTHELVVHAEDDPHDLAKPRGKQDWQARPHSIWYPRTSGIWQTVWLEPVSAARLSAVRWTPDLASSEVRLVARVEGAVTDRHRLRVVLSHDGNVLCDDVCSVAPDGWVRRTLPVAPSATEDFAIDLLWTPEHPNLIDADLHLLDTQDRIVDEVRSYTALRGVGIDGDRFVLNRRPRTLRLVLNQGYWRDGGLTPPDDDALRRDVELIKRLGFDGVRMHQKIESPRFLYWADRLGLLVWEEMPSPYRFDPLAVRRTMVQWAEAIERDASHPCIVAWVPINESWGVPDLPVRGEQRDFVRAMYHMTRSLDPTRPVIGNDGWEIDASDITAVHDYDGDPARLASRYRVGTEEELVAMLKRERPGHRRLILEEYEPRDRPVMLTEFGGIAYSERAGDWGYSRATTAEEFSRQYSELLAAVRSLPKLAGWCYTQFTDTYQEANGLLYMDRSPKADPEALRRAVVG